MLELKNLYKTFNAGTVNEKRAIDGLDLTLEDGDFVTIIGGNGAGKSTTLNLIAGVFPADQGSIILDGVDITRLPEHKRAKYLGRVFQDVHFIMCPVGCSHRSVSGTADYQTIASLSRPDQTGRAAHR